MYITNYICNGNKFTNNNNINGIIARFHGYLSPCLYRLCWVSIGILCVRVAFVFLWLTNLLNNENNINYFIYYNNNNNINNTIITSLLLRQVSYATKYNNNNNSICLEFYNINDAIRIFNYCKRNYHSFCFEKWLNNCKYKRYP